MFYSRRPSSESFHPPLVRAACCAAIFNASARFLALQASPHGQSIFKQLVILQRRRFRIILIPDSIVRHISIGCATSKKQKIPHRLSPWDVSGSRLLKDASSPFLLLQSPTAYNYCSQLSGIHTLDYNISVILSFQQFWLCTRLNSGCLQA